MELWTKMMQNVRILFAGVQVQQIIRMFRLRVYTIGQVFTKKRKLFTNRGQKLTGTTETETFRYNMLLYRFGAAVYRQK